MKNTLEIYGEIGWDIFPDDVRQGLDGKKGDLDVFISSPGGFVDDGIEIYNVLRDYKRSNPDAQMMGYIKGQASSMASYIASGEFFDLVAIEDNATFMVHNPHVIVMGTHKDLDEARKRLLGYTDFLKSAYTKRTGKTEKEISEAMDAETWYFGQEIIDAGFADEIIKTESSWSKDSAVANAKAKFKSMRSVSKNSFDAAAKVGLRLDPQGGGRQIAGSGDTNQNIISEEEVMNAEKLKSEHKEVYDQVFALGVEKGKQEEVDRVKAISELKAKPEYQKITHVVDRLDKAISDGETVQDAKLGIMTVLADPSAAAEYDSPQDFSSPSAGTASGEAQKKERKW